MDEYTQQHAEAFIVLLIIDAGGRMSLFDVFEQDLALCFSMLPDSDNLPNTIAAIERLEQRGIIEISNDDWLDRPTGETDIMLCDEIARKL